MENKFRSLGDYFASGITKPYAFRLEMLNLLEKVIIENEQLILDALFKDLRKPKQEALFCEIAVTIEEIRLIKKNLRRWMQPKKTKVPIALLPSKGRVFYEPLGTVLIIGPWNYPFYLIMAPLIGAIAAGNCSFLKSSEVTPYTSKLIEQLIEKTFPANYISVSQGGVAETTTLLNMKFDHIFFTGSTAVGAIVMQAAAKNLVPVTLELGGKSPAIVSENSNLDLAARRIVWGKFYNAGQTCVAPDYVYVNEKIANQFVDKLKFYIEEQFGTDQKNSLSLSRIVNQKNFDRLLKLIDPKKTSFGGHSDLKDLYIQPTLMTQIDWSDSVMNEEIFGPILPILTYEKLSDAIKQIRSKPKPLAAYFFSNSCSEKDLFINDLSFGGGCINDTLIHLGNPYLPFGGVGQSGQGSYHGYDSFRVFSHAKSVMLRYKSFDFDARYAPYNEKKISFLRRVFGI